MPMQRYLGWAVVDALIDGKGPYKFVVDTGAPGLFVSSRLAEELNLADHPDFGGMGGQLLVAGPGGQGGIPATMHRVQSLQLGLADLRTLTTIALELPFPRHIVGVIGVGVFGDCMLTLDYPASRIVLARGELSPANGGDILDFTQPRQRGSHPVIEVDVCGKPVDFTLDTGMTGWFRFTKAAADICSFAHGPVAGPNARQVDRELVTQVGRLKGRLRFGSYVIDRPHGLVDGDDDVGSILGSRVLQEFTLTFDQKNKRLRFARDSKEPIVPPPYRVAGFLLQQEDPGFEVWGLMSGSPAEKAGLKNGDVVVEIDGRPVEEVFGWPAWDALLEGESIRLSYRATGKGEVRRIEVQVLELVP
ncbi:MAG: PDZ domain-containing protein [bacterium]|nr:PDZ domain-containing protein [bacterium]